MNRPYKLKENPVQCFVEEKKKKKLLKREQRVRFEEKIRRIISNIVINRGDELNKGPAEDEETGSNYG